MAEITVEKLIYYYDKAQKAKDGVTEKYNEVLNYTDVSYQISEDKSDNKDRREVEEVISESITTIVNFIMSNVFPRGLRWASLEMNETLFKQEEGANLKLDHRVMPAQRLRSYILKSGLTVKSNI